MSEIVMDKFPVLRTLDRDVKASIQKVFVLNSQNAFVITKDDNLMAVGSNFGGCLGTGTDGAFNELREITPLCKREICDISYGLWYLLALSAEGSVYSWGRNEYGQLGNGTTNHGPSPAPVTHIQHKKIVQVACGGFHSLALSDDGEIYAWGYVYGQIGNERNQLVPLTVTSQIGTRRAISIACGCRHSVALVDNGEVYTWGCNDYGQLGLGNDDYRQSIPCKVEALSGEVIIQIVCGRYHTMVLSQQGCIYSWGENRRGQLGTGYETSYNHPKQILMDERFIEIAAVPYSNISAGLTDTGRVYMWGGGTHTSPYLTEYTIIDEVFANIPDEPFTWRLCSVEDGALKPKHMHTVSSCETQTDINSISFREFEKLKLQLDEIEKEKENLKKDNDTWSRKHEILFNENQDLRQEREVLRQQNKALCKEIELIRTDQAQLSEKSKIDENNFAKTSTYCSKTQEEGGEENDLLAKEIDGLKHQIHQLDNEGKALRKEMESMKTNLARLTDENSLSQIDTSEESISGSQYHSIRFGELHRKVHQFGRQLELFKDEFDQVTDGETLGQNNLSKQASFEVKKQAGKDCTKWDEEYKELNLKPHDFTKENKRLNLTEQTDPIKDLVEDLSKAFDDSTTCDIKFNTPDGVIFCHKAILQIRCAYLKSRFESGLEEETKDTIEVPYTYSIYRAFLYFLYTGTISLELKDCIGLLALSNTYGEDGLKRQCENILKRGIAVENSALLYSAALDADAKEIEEYCFNFIVDHLPDVVETEGFSNLDKATRKAIMMKVRQKATWK